MMKKPYRRIQNLLKNSKKRKGCGMGLDFVFKKLIKKQVTYQSGNLGLNLLITRLQGKYSSNQTEEELNRCLQEMQAFFTKYSSIMQKDIEELKKL